MFETSFTPVPLAAAVGPEKISKIQPATADSQNFSAEFLGALLAPVEPLPPGSGLPPPGNTAPGPFAPVSSSEMGAGAVAATAVAGAPLAREAGAPLTREAGVTPRPAGGPEAQLRGHVPAALPGAPDSGHEVVALRTTTEAESPRKARAANGGAGGDPEREGATPSPARPLVLLPEARGTVGAGERSGRLTPVQTEILTPAALAGDRAAASVGEASSDPGFDSFSPWLNAARDSAEIQRLPQLVGGPPLRLNAGNGQEQLLQRMSLVVTDQMQHARIIIDPPELGPLDMRVALNGNEAHVQFTAYHAATRDLIEEALPRLKEMLDAAGLALADADIQEQRHGRGDASAFAEATGSSAPATGHDETAVIERLVLAPQGLLDVYA